MFLGLRRSWLMYFGGMGSRDASKSCVGLSCNTSIPRAPSWLSTDDMHRGSAANNPTS